MSSMNALLLSLVSAVGCATSPRPLESVRSPARTENTAAPPPASSAAPDAVAFVAGLMEEPDRVAEALDMRFVELLMRAQPGKHPPTKEEVVGQIRTLLKDIPAGCELGFALDDGYSNLAIPPPTVDQDAQQIALVESAVAGLEAGREVTVLCRDFVEQGAPASDAAPADRWLFGFNLFLQGKTWRIRAWRGFGAEQYR
jgi:hypothetical protein